MFEGDWQQEKLDRHILASQAFPFGIGYLDDALMGLLPNELFLVGARTGRGKTELATTIAYQAANLGKNVTFFALEADKWEIERRMKYRKLAQLYQKHYARSKAFVLPRYREWLLQGYSADWDQFERMAEQELRLQTATLRVIYKSDRYTADDFVKEFETIQNETDVFIVDHLHYFDLVGRTETDGLKNAIHAIRNASICHGKPVVLLAHLRKADKANTKTLPDLDDFHGHSDIVKVATTVLLMSAVPDENPQSSIGRFPTYFHIAKCRTASEVTNYVGALGFDFSINSYREQYHLNKASFSKDPTPIENGNDFPDWAKHATKPIVATIIKEQVKLRRPYGDD